ncbi:centrosomal protein POC5 isoform X5 [Pseudophryne corroboree]|uniref:centrosomal protein POC5 isoform X5 n=1 Tax=Pseudophryne corroboree TaxID=495146 RepID=UPI0030819420
MSSDEERSRSPVIPKDSDHGSSVSSDFQDEYDELLRYAVVTPKFGPHLLREYQLTAEQTTSDRFSSPKEAVQEQIPERSHTSLIEDIPKCSDGELHRGSSDTSNPRPSVFDDQKGVLICTFISEQQAFERSPFASGMEAFSPVHSSELSLHGTSSSASSRSQVEEVRVTELPVPSEDMQQVEGVLDLWSGNLKVISNLTHALEKQKEKIELMRTFTHWRLQQTEARQEEYVCNLADRHYRKALMKNMWRMWHSAIELNWKDKVERACRARAEEVCIELSNDYESKVAQLNGALEDARAEVQRLHAERGQFEGSMKKAFMRGVCALNMEAMSMFQGRESRMDQADQPPRREDRSSSPTVTFQQLPTTSVPLSSSQHDLPTPVHTPAVLSEQNFKLQFGPSSASESKDDVSTPVVMSATTSGSSILSTQKLPATRVLTSGHQKAGRTITARVTARSDLAQKISKTGGNIGSMGVSPPMSSIVVEKHHPITQQTISQATAAKYPRSVQQSANSLSGRGTGQNARTSHVHTGIHSIKVVD